ncbi:hypothetical protein M9Y10_024871 [Tritrichomonas musculus]|uniref:Transmembrane protein n=1 Tax=Tritrichomonas musculus TaxID=1915356 RepID=A0ABR2HBH7_9EUKA
MNECFCFSFILFRSVYCIINVGIDGNRFDTTLTYINYSIFYKFHNIHSDIGGAIYINKPETIIEFHNLGFIDCSTMNECGAFYIWGQSTTISNLCGFQCEAINNQFQFFNAHCETLSENQMSLLTITFCGPNNRGISAMAASGRTTFRISNINSSYNYNHPNDDSFGACLRSIDSYDFHIFNFNFLHSTGSDIVSTHFSQQNPVVASHFMNGNIVNCTASSIIKFRGTNYMTNVYFCKLDYSGRSFEVAETIPNAFLLQLTNSYFDVLPTDVSGDSHIDMINCQENSPFFTLQINQNDNELCQIPVFQSQEFTLSENFSPSSEFSSSKLFSPSSEFTSSRQFSPSSEFSSSRHFSSSVVFSPSSKFTSSRQFSPSSKFTSSRQFSPSSNFLSSKTFSPSLKFTFSKKFSPSSQFSSSKSFSPSLKFTSSGQFSPSSQFLILSSLAPSSEFSSSDPFTPSQKVPPSQQTGTFTPSSIFTPSFTFSPEATKYPDGIQKADVVKRQGSNAPATVAQIGATAGVSFVFIVVAIVLMLLYLRSKKKQMQEQDIEFSDSLLDDGLSSDDTSYSYSYYTYEEYYVDEVSANDCYESYEYSSFDVSEGMKNEIV